MSPMTALLLFILALLLRIWNIQNLAEFLGDQGRTGLILYHAWTTKIIPLVGPPILTAQHLGPFFYYFLFPSFLVSKFHPLGPAIFLTVVDSITVLCLYFLARKLCTKSTAIVLGLLYATSPLIITQSRN